MFTLNLLDKEPVAIESVEDANLVLSELSVSIAEVTGEMAIESMKMDHNIFIAEETFKNNIDELVPGTESFLSKTLDMVKKAFKAAIDFIKNVGKKIFKLFKKVWDFITGMFSGRRSKGGGGGSSGTRERMEEKKEKVEKEIKEILETPDTNSRTEKSEVFAVKRRKGIALAISKHPTYFAMPIADNSITAENILAYADTMVNSFMYINGNIINRILGPDYNPVMTMLISSKSSKVGILASLDVLVASYEAFMSEKVADTKDDIKEMVNSNRVKGAIDALENIAISLQNINDVANNISNIDMSDTAIRFNGSEIPVPNSIQDIFDKEVYGEDIKVKRVLAFVGRKKLGYLNIKYDSSFDNKINDKTELLTNMLSTESEYAIEDVLSNIVSYLTFIANSYAIEIKVYDYNDDVSDDAIDKLVSSMRIRESNVESILDNVIGILKNSESKGTELASIGNKTISKYEDKVNGVTADLAKLGARLRKINSSPIGAIANTTETINGMARLATIVSKNLVNPLKSFLGMTTDGGSVINSMINTTFEDDLTERKADQYSLINLLVYMYGLKRLEDNSLLHS